MTFDPLFSAVLLIVLFLAILGGTVALAVLASSRGIRARWILRSALVLVLFAMLMRPTLPGGGSPETIGGDVDVYFVIDTTSSMAAEDWGDGEPRLTGVRDDVVDITEELAGARFSVVTFDAATVQRVPLTTDGGAVEQTVSAMTQEITRYSSGSSISAPVETLDELFAERTDERRTIVYYIGDGEQTVSEPPESFADLASYIDGGAVLGYGTSDGGKMREYSGFESTAEPDYIMDPETDEPALSRIDEEALGVIADQLGVTYIHRDAASPVSEATRGIHVTPEAEPDVNPEPRPELYWILAIPFGVLLAFEGTLLVRDLRRTRDRGGERS